MPAGSEEHALDQTLGIHCAVRSQRDEGIRGARLAGGDIGDVIGQHVKVPNLHGPIKELEALDEFFLHDVASLVRLLQQLHFGNRAG